MKHYNASLLPIFLSCAAVKAELRAKIFKVPFIVDPVDPVDEITEQNAFLADSELSMSMPTVSGFEDSELTQWGFYEMPTMSMSMSVESGENTSSMVMIMAVDESEQTEWVIPGVVTESVSDEPMQASSTTDEYISEGQFTSPTYAPSELRAKSNKRTKSPTAPTNDPNFASIVASDEGESTDEPFNSTTVPTNDSSFASIVAVSVEDASTDEAAANEVHGKAHKSQSSIAKAGKAGHDAKSKKSGKSRKITPSIQAPARAPSTPATVTPQPVATTTTTTSTTTTSTTTTTTTTTTPVPILPRT